METAAPTRSVLILDDGRRVEHPADVNRWDVVELEGGQLYFVTAALTGTKRATGEPFTVATLSAVKR